MHVFNLGVGQWMLGSATVLLNNRGCFGPEVPLASALDELHAGFKTWCRERQIEPFRDE